MDFWRLAQRVDDMDDDKFSDVSGKSKGCKTKQPQEGIGEGEKIKKDSKATQMARWAAETKARLRAQREARAETVKRAREVERELAERRAAERAAKAKRAAEERERQLQAKRERQEREQRKHQQEEAERKERQRQAKEEMEKKAREAAAAAMMKKEQERMRREKEEEDKKLAREQEQREKLKEEERKRKTEEQVRRRMAADIAAKEAMRKEEEAVKERLRKDREQYKRRKKEEAKRQAEHCRQQERMQRQKSQREAKERARVEQQAWENTAKAQLAVRARARGWATRQVASLGRPQGACAMMAGKAANAHMAPDSLQVAFAGAPAEVKEVHIDDPSLHVELLGHDGGVEASLPEHGELESITNPVDSHLEMHILREVFGGGHEEARNANRSCAAAASDLPSQALGERNDRCNIPEELEAGLWPSSRHTDGSGSLSLKEARRMMATRVSSGKVTKKPLNANVLPWFEDMENDDPGSSHGLESGTRSDHCHEKYVVEGSERGEERATGQSPLLPLLPNLGPKEEGIVRLNGVSTSAFLGESEVDLATWLLCKNGTQALTRAAASESAEGLAHGMDGVCSRATAAGGRPPRPQVMTREDKGRQRLSLWERMEGDSDALSMPGPSVRQKLDFSSVASWHPELEDEMEGQENEPPSSNEPRTSYGLGSGESSDPCHEKYVLESCMRDPERLYSPLRPLSLNLGPKEEGIVRLNRESANAFLGGGEVLLSPAVESEGFALRSLGSWGRSHNDTQALTIAGVAESMGGLANWRDGIGSRANWGRPPRPQVVEREDKGRKRLSLWEKLQESSDVVAMPAPSVRQKLDFSSFSSWRLQPEEDPVSTLLDHAHNALNVRNPEVAGSDKLEEVADMSCVIPGSPPLLPRITDEEEPACEFLSPVFSPPIQPVAHSPDPSWETNLMDVVSRFVEGQTSPTALPHTDPTQTPGPIIEFSTPPRSTKSIQQVVRPEDSSSLSPMHKIESPRLKVHSGVIAVELVGNGSHTRALIREGQLQYAECWNASGCALRIICTDVLSADIDARSWIEGQKDTPNSEGEVTAPPDCQNVSCHQILLTKEEANSRQFTGAAQASTTNVNCEQFQLGSGFSECPVGGLELCTSDTPQPPASAYQDPREDVSTDVTSNDWERAPFQSPENREPLPYEVGKELDWPLATSPCWVTPPVTQKTPGSENVFAMLLEEMARSASDPVRQRHNRGYRQVADGEIEVARIVDRVIRSHKKCQRRRQAHIAPY